MKYILIALAFLSAPVFANSEYYFGVGAGTTTFNIEAQQELDQKIDSSGSRLAVEVLEQAGYPIITDFNLSSPSNRVFIGKSLNTSWDVEASIEKLGKFSVAATLEGDGEVNLTGDIAGKGYGKATLNINTISLSLIGKLPVAGRFSLYNRLGLAYMRASVATNTDVGYSYSYNNGEEYVGEESFTEVKSKRSQINTLVPVVGLGVKYDFTKKYSVRVEYTRSGNIIGDVYTESANVELLYRF